MNYLFLGIVKTDKTAYLCSKLTKEANETLGT